ncbi:metal ABC transporter ATP-binding protein [Marinospirillum insulare]|uniref:ABC transporter permease n=1 Tax=Marinospirillum insulare TaxID=217169 RepID=A0ABQ6A0M1_9GAMM|nr:ABC transporter ATP-binding protein [Marinospirillum insulare]GLR64812.1 ABC transporter permease [Marinospirillum insulare]
MMKVNPAKPLIEFNNLTLGYEMHPAVHHLDGQILAGDLLAVVGPNGGGKSTLLKGLMEEIRPLGGKITWPQGRPQLAYLPQRARLDLDFPLRVADFVSLGHWPRRGAFSTIRAVDKQAVDQALNEVGLAGFGKRSLDSLSGGQLQRVLFARLLLEDAPLILLDEPFAAVDAATTEDLLKLIKHWQKEGRTLIAVLHDLHQVRNHFPKCLLLARDVLGMGKTESVLTSANLAKARKVQVLADPLAPICDFDEAEEQA